MRMSKEQILAAAMALDVKEREEIAEDLWQSVPLELTDEQRAELRRRSDAIDRGDMQMIPGEQVLRELRQRFCR